MSERWVVGSMGFALAFLSLGEAAGATEVGKERIVVVGRRIAPRDIDAVPSVATLDPAQMATLHIDSLADVANTVPSLSALPAGVMAVTQYTIRGLYSPVGAATVALYLDDVPVAVRPSAFLAPPDLEALDLTGIDVARGPQGTASGPAALAGVVRLRTRQPDFDRADGWNASEVRLTELGAPSVKTGFAAGAPLSPAVALRVAASVERRGGYIDRVGGPADVDSSLVAVARATLGVRVGGWTVTPSVTVQHRRIGDLPLAQEGLGRFRQGFVRRQRGRDDLLATSLHVDGEVGSTKVTAIGTRLDRGVRQDVDYSSVFGELVLGGTVPGLLVPGGTLSRITSRQAGWTAELRAGSAATDRPLTWTAGVQASHTSLRIGQSVKEPGIATLTQIYLQASVADLFGTPLIDGMLSYRSAERDRETSVAGYATASWTPSPRWRFTAGTRLTTGRFDVQSEEAGPYAGTAITGLRHSRERWTRLLPRLSASWQLTGSAELVATVARGFRPGGGNVPVSTALCNDDLAALGRKGAPLAYAGDVADTGELSLRGETGRGPVTLTAFGSVWRDLAQQVDLPGCGFGYVDNLGRARVRGVEAEGSQSLWRGVTVDAAIGYQDARFTRTIAAGPAVIVSAGDRLPYVPRLTGHAGVMMVRPLAGGANLSVGLTYRGTGDFRRSPGPAALGHRARGFKGPAVGRLDALAGVARAHLQIEVFVRNLTNRRPLLYDSVDLSPVSETFARQGTITPRTWGLRLQWGR